MNDPMVAQKLQEFPLNRAATRLLKMAGKPVLTNRFPLSQAVLVGLQHWNPRGDRSSQALLRLVKVGEAETPEQFAETLRPFMDPLAWDQKQAVEMEGYPPYSPTSLDSYLPRNLRAEAGKCHNLTELLNILEGQETETMGSTWR